MIPVGWNFNPSTWPSRLFVIILSSIGLAIAGYMAFYQFDIINNFYEPFFGEGSIIILNSPVSEILPIPDAALRALAYFTDAITGIIGGTARWRKMPWIVLIFGTAVGPVGAISILLVILQPMLYDAWCTLCLCTALISVLMIGPAMAEYLATLQYIRQETNKGRSFWKTVLGYKNQ
ncbi:MAG: vitamin K epoxide reductase family protein [Cytophagaceae bacterium]